MTTNSHDSDVLNQENWQKDCAAQYFGVAWAIDKPWLDRAVSAIKDGTYRAGPKSQLGDEDNGRPVGYVNRGGLAILSIQGPVMKARSKFGGTSSVDTRAALRKAATDDSVQSILLHIDSPGGTVAGSFELAKDIARINKEFKPVYAHIEDLGASAAYLFASQARRITADATSYIGSIGVVTSLVDTSGQLEKMGIKIETVSTGGMKGAGNDGRVTDDMREEAQQRVDEIGDHFVAAVASGRSMSESRVRGLADGRVHMADKAKELGLIDGVASIDAVVASIREDEKEPEMNEPTTETSATVTVAEPVETNHEPKAAERIDDTTADTTPEANTMADSNKNSPEQTPAAGAGDSAGSEVTRLNRQAIEAHRKFGREQGHKDGYAKAVEDLRAIAAVCPGREALAVRAFLAGQGVETVKLIYDAELAAEARSKEESARKDEEIARLNLLVATGGHGGVMTALDSGDDSHDDHVHAGMSAEEQAKMEWDSDSQLRAKHGNNEKRYMLFRVNQLHGNVRAYSRVS